MCAVRATDARRHATNQQLCGFTQVSGTGQSRPPTHGPDLACSGSHRPRHPSAARQSAQGIDGVRRPASTRLGQSFGPAADEHPGLSGFSLLIHGREAFIARLALADLAERSLDMQYYSWDGDITGRIIVDSVMKAADRGVRVRLLVDDRLL